MMSGPEGEVDLRATKARLFGEDESDGLRKRVAKARFLQALAEHAEGRGELSQGSETSEQRDGATEPKAGSYGADPVRVGRFTVLRKLGQGGMGIVYAAYDEELDRKVALKLIRSDLLRDERGRARMQREAQALARLSHPNVVQVHEISHWDEHDVVTMEFVPGLTLDRWLDARKRSWDEILAVMVQAGRGLEAAHAAGLVHRDLKPSNLIVGDDQRVRVLDFGLARAANDGDSDPRMHVADLYETGSERAADPHTELPGAVTGSRDDSKGMRSETECGSAVFDRMLTATGAKLGTPAYMSPEQHLGRRATPLSDQFSFCLVLYEALYGERPYRARTRDEYATRVIEGEFVIPPVGSGVPVWLRDAVCRGLRAKPAERWSSMTELLAELTRDRRRRWTRLAIAASLVGVFAGGLALSSIDQAPLCAFDPTMIGDWDASARAAVGEVFRRSGHASAEARFAQVERSLDAYVDELVEGYADACRMHRVEQRQTSAQFELREACLEQRERELRAVVEELVQADASVVDRAPQILASVGDVGLCEHPELLEPGVPVAKDAATIATIADVRQDIARGHAAREAGRMQAAEQFADEARTRADQLEHAGLRAEVAYLFGANAFAHLDYEGAEAELLAAAKLAESGGSIELQARVALMAARTECQLGQRSRYPLVLAEAKVAQLGEPIDMQVELSYVQGLMSRDSGEPTLALAQFGRAVELASMPFMGSDHLLARVLTARARMLSSLGRQDEAHADLERALGLGLDPDDVNAISSLFDYGVLELENQNYARAKRLIDGALAGYERVYGDKYEYVGHAHLALAQIAMNTDRVAEAEVHIERALEVLDAAHPQHAWALGAVAALHLLVERSDEAIDELGRAVALAEQARDVENLAYLRGRLGRALAHVQRNEQALAPLQASIAGYEEIGPSIDMIEPLMTQAGVLRALGQPERALASLERALELLADASGRPVLSAEVHIELALTLEQLEQGDRAREAARAAKRILADTPDHLQMLDSVRHLLST